MRSLYNYVHESLLDDEDELMDKLGDKFKYNELLNKDNNWLKPHSTPFKGIYAYDNHKLYLNDCVDLLDDFGKLVKDAKIDEVWTYEVCTNDFFRNNSLDNIKSFNCYSIHNNRYVSHIGINNTNINIKDSAELKTVIDKNTPPHPSRLSFNWGQAKPLYFWSNTCKLNNVSINFFDNLLYKQLIFSCQTLPEITNLKSNVESMVIYSPSVLKKPETIKVLDKVFYLGFDFEWRDVSKIAHGEDMGSYQVKKIKSFKQIYPLANNYKKYGPRAGIYNHKYFKLRTDVNLSDIFPWIKSLKDLKSIKIHDNNIDVIFRKKSLAQQTVSNPDEQTYTKDDWMVRVKKRI
jgi:hypothetical protein